MASAATQAPQQAAPTGQLGKEQQQKAVMMNGVRLQHIVDRLRFTFHGSTTILPPAHFHNLVYAFARGIDYALSGGDVPKMAGQIPDILRKVYQLRNDPFLQSSVLVLVMSCKNACHNKWFQHADFVDILKMADELSANFCTPGSQPANDRTVLEIVSTVMPRYYPWLKFDRLVTSLEAKVGYDVLMADFFIHRNLPRNEKISLIVVQKENLDTSSCITSPQHASFLVNGKGVDKRTNVSMETGPQFPTDITKMLKYGANILQAVGYFNANYVIAVAVVNNLIPFDAPKLNDYAQPVTTDLPDSDILEGPSRVSLKCPISFGRIKTSIKGNLCKHYQCFDYDNYMEMNLRKPVWRCPCCSTPSNLMDLRIDQKMAKVLQETGDDVFDVFLFPDGSWKAVSVHDDKSDRHSGDILQQNGDTVETDATHSDVIDLINGSDDGDLPMSSASASEDMKPLLKSRDLYVTHYLQDLPMSTTAQPEDLYVGGGNNGRSNGTSTSGQNSLPSSTGGASCTSFGTLESILPRNILQVQSVTMDSVSPLETSNSAFAMQQVSQGTYPDFSQMQTNQFFGSGVGRPHIPRNVRREPVAVQALGVPPQNLGSSRRVQPNVLNCLPPAPWTQLSSASSNYLPYHVTNDSVITTMNSGARPLSRSPDTSLLHLQPMQQDMHNTPNHHHGWVVGLAAPPSMGTRLPIGGTGHRGANSLLHNLMGQNVYEASHAFPTQPGGAVNSGIQIYLLAAQHSQASRSQAMSRPATPHMQLPVQSGMPETLLSSLEWELDLARTRQPSAVTALSPPLLDSTDVQELEVDPNWQPTGQMRGSLTGSAYNQAIERYTNQQTSQAPLLDSTNVQELEVDPNWQPTGQMRGSLTGSAYNQAIKRYTNQQTSQAPWLDSTNVQELEVDPNWQPMRQMRGSLTVWRCGATHQSSSR